MSTPPYCLVDEGISEQALVTIVRAARTDPAAARMLRRLRRQWQREAEHLDRLLAVIDGAEADAARTNDRRKGEDT